MLIISKQFVEEHGGDVITNPKHEHDGELIRFDYVISNPPFSKGYSKRDVQHDWRFKYGFTKGKKADLMFAQHMLSMLVLGGRMATVMPHGVLFRSGDEKKIRKSFIDSDELEAIISLPPNLFYGTGIPACILVMRARRLDSSGKPLERRGKIALIHLKDIMKYVSRAVLARFEEGEADLATRLVG